MQNLSTYNKKFKKYWNTDQTHPETFQIYQNIIFL